MLDYDPTVSSLRQADRCIHELPGPYRHRAGQAGWQALHPGLRVTVYDVLSYLAAGMTIDEVLADFPALERDDILACLSYAAERERQTLVARA